jgi:cellobiose-specific phosphotransferase system component IIC
LHARYVRAIVTGVVFAVPAALCISVASTLINRAVAPLLAEGRDPNAAGCDVFFIGLLALAVIFALAGVVTAAWSRKHIADSKQASVAAGIAGAVASIVSCLPFVVPWFQEQMSHDTNTGVRHIIFAVAGTMITGIIIGVIYLYMGFGSGLLGGYMYDRHRNKKSHR